MCWRLFCAIMNTTPKKKRLGSIGNRNAVGHGAPKGNKNAAYSLDEREVIKKEYLAWMEEGNFPSYFPKVKPETVESWFDSDTEKVRLENSKRIYHNKIASIGLDQARGLSQGNTTAWIFIMKNVLGWKDKQEVEHTGLPEPPSQLEVILVDAHAAR